MSAITALTENFTGATAGTAISTSNTIFDNVGGPGASSIVVDPVLGGANRMMRVVCSSQLKAHAMDFTAQQLIWFTFDLYIGTTVDTNTAILNGYQTNAATAGEKIFDLRLLGGTRQLNLRSINSAVWTSTDLALSTKYRIAVMVKLGSSNRRLRVMVLDADGTTVQQDSGEIAATASISTIAHLKIGALSDNTSDLYFGRLRGDDTDGPAISPPATVTLGPDIVGVEPGTEITLTANVTGSGTFTWVQVAGPTVALGGSPNAPTRTLTAPAYWPSGSAPSAPTLTYRVTYGTAQDFINITPAVHTRWRKTPTGWQPVYPAWKFS